MTDVTLVVNGEEKTASVPPETTLLKMLRENMDLTGAKLGCDVGDCGACTVLLDGLAVNACLVLAGQAEGKEVLTIEGLSTLEKYHPIQKAFEDVAALQCGFCGPGMIIATKALIDQGEDLTRQEIKDALSGNLCRCTGYTKIIEGVVDAYEEITGKKMLETKPRAA
ncbi:MAG: (2Fe-2S)-binding protein [Rhodospirillales bacterium]|jgi:aerobic-type carbon monoxide dehydrogenase small subunit (CoxS/CutS family)